MKQINVLLFDLGSTLIFSRDPWSDVLPVADQALLASLHQSGLCLTSENFFQEFGGFLDGYYAARGYGTIERTTFVALKEFLAEKGCEPVEDALVRKALDEMYSVTQKNWCLEQDSIPTLDRLLSNGFRLGLISNTSDDKNVQQLIDQHGLRNYFEFIITSAGCGIRKPDSRIFQAALDHFTVESDCAAMVGDTPEADILGANQMGIYSIWITRRYIGIQDGELAIQPQAVVTALDQIPALLQAVNSKPG